MTGPLTIHLIELAETLHDLRRRLRQAARLEVARAVGEALREASLALICGPTRYRAPNHTVRPEWDDPWQEPATDPWRSGASYRETSARDDPEDTQGRSPLPPAVLVGLAAARWGYVRTRQVGPALLLGLLVGVAAHSGGPTVQALLEAWSATHDLLHHPGPDARP
jgi:hypothetical protein